MITELEEQVIRLVKNTIAAAIDYYENNYSAQETIEEILKRSEVMLHQEAVEQLVEWLKKLEV